MKYLWKCFLAAVALSVQAIPAMAQAPAAPAPVITEAPSVNCCDSGCDSGCHRGGMIGGIEYLLLKPYNSEGNAPVFDDVIEIVNQVLPLAGLNQLNEPDWDLKSAVRLWAGYQNAEGLGVRLTYFQFDQSVDAQTTFANVGGGVQFVDIGFNYAYDARTFDVEAIQSFNPNRNWNLVVGAGFRYAEYTERNLLNIGITGFNPGEFIGVPGLIETGFDSQSYGLTTSLEARRRVGGNFALFLGTRASILFGNEKEIIGINAAGGIPPEIQTFINDLLTEDEQDNIKFIYEARMGVEWNRETARGGMLFARMTAEAQYWDKFTGTPVLNSNGAFGLLGFGLAAGIYR